MKPLFDLAIEYTGHDKDHLTEFQENEIDALVQFGKRVLESRPTQRAADLAVCAPELHKQLDNQGFRFCGYCGYPLNR